MKRKEASTSVDTLFRTIISIFKNSYLSKFSWKSFHLNLTTIWKISTKLFLYIRSGPLSNQVFNLLSCPLLELCTQHTYCSHACLLTSDLLTGGCFSSTGRETSCLCVRVPSERIQPFPLLIRILAYKPFYLATVWTWG